MKTAIIPIPVDAEIAELIKQGAKATGLKKADVMRQGLRLGVPALVQRLAPTQAAWQPKCLEYIDEYPDATISAREIESALREKMAKKYGRAHR